LPLLLPTEYVGSGRVKDAERVDLVGADPGAGVEISETVPAGVAWEIIAAQFLFTTSATAGNREPHLIVTDGSDVEKVRAGSASTQGASITDKRWCFSVNASIAAGVTYAFIPLPPGLIVPPGWKVKTAVGGLQVGDNLSAPTLYIVRYQLG
jgi:hypothetical protein